MYTCCMLPAAIDWHREDFYSSLEYNSLIFCVFDGLWGRLCAVGEEIWIDPSVLWRLISTGKTFTPPLSTILRNLSFYGFQRKIGDAVEEIWMNPLYTVVIG